MKLLAIDTASACCSAALWIDGAVSEVSTPTVRDHARLLLPMVQQLLQAADVRLSALSAVAFGRGPGSFTGLRIAAGVAQGLALGTGLGVVPVSDLAALAAQALRRLDGGDGVQRVLACMDARMSEVYAAEYAIESGRVGATLLPERVVAPARLVQEAGPGGRLAAGRGLDAWPQIAAGLGIAAAHCLGDAEPQARDVALLAARALAAGEAPLPPEQAQPVYLRDQVASPPL